MTKEQWVERAKSELEVLRSIVSNYHPAIRSRRQRLSGVQITAPSAQMAADTVIKAEKFEEEKNPVKVLEDALESGNVRAAARVLDATWFGVPESTSCWQITGFATLVDLLDEMPEEGQ